MNQNTIPNICIKTVKNFPVLYKIWVPYSTTSWNAINSAWKTIYKKVFPVLVVSYLKCYKCSTFCPFSALLWCLLSLFSFHTKIFQSNFVVTLASWTFPDHRQK